MQRRVFLQTSAAAIASAFAPLHAAAAPNVRLGDDVLLDTAWTQLGSRGVGIITNQSGVTSDGRSIVDALHRNDGVALRAIFAPEHGFRGDHAAGNSVDSSVDAATGLPVYSLYGATRHPTPSMLSGIEVLIFDIQDVGSRAYTYISTMAYAMQSAAQHDIEFWVCDRPNPVGGTMVEGPVLEPAYSSFIGLYPIAMRHGMTVGELARLFNDRFSIGAKLRVISMQNYTRAMIWPQTGLNWIPTSPNIPHWQTTFPYLCTGLIDNLGMNNGVGTPDPFFYAGALDVAGDALAERLNARALPGVRFEPASWSPQRGFWLGKTLTGVKLVVDDDTRFAAIRTAVEIATGVRDLFPRVIDIDKPDALDRDWGTDALRRGIKSGASADAIVASWKASTEAFAAMRQRYLLY